MHIAITGASSGIGEALALHFGCGDCRLSLVARREEKLAALAVAVGAEALVCPADLSDLARCCDWIEQAEAAHGPIDVLINNAGVQYVADALSIDDVSGEKLMSLNLLAPVRIINRVAPGMVERGHGTIVNVSSVAAFVSTPGMAHYSASKAALASYSEVLRVELASSGVHVMTVYPGPVRTPMEAAAREMLDSKLANLMPSGEPGRLARMIDRGVRQRRARVIYPRLYAVSRIFRVTAQRLTDRLTPRPKLM